MSLSHLGFQVSTPARRPHSGQLQDQSHRFRTMTPDHLSLICNPQPPHSLASTPPIWPEPEPGTQILSLTRALPFIPPIASTVPPRSLLTPVSVSHLLIYLISMAISISS